jgi:hypothetical protein
MSPRSAAILACRIIALVLGITAVTAIISFLLIAREFGGSGPFWGYVGPTLVISYVLWVFADRISEPMTRGTDVTAVPVHRLVHLQAVVFSVVGVILIAEAIPDLISAAAASYPSFDGGVSPFSLRGFPFPDRGAAILGGLARIAIGVALILGSRSLAEWLTLRNPEPEAQQPPAGPPADIP